MNFKVGDKVRVVDLLAVEYPHRFYLAGMTGTVAGFEPHRRYLQIAVALDGHPSHYDDGHCRFAAVHLAPLTPPAVDTWAEDAVRKVTKPQHLEPACPMPEKVPAGHRVAHLPTGVFLLKPDPLNAGKWLAVEKIFRNAE